MLRGGRLADPCFCPDEALYWRCTKATLRSIQLRSGAAFRCPDFSVNRGKYSAPEWVLLPCHHGQGIIQLLVGDIPVQKICPKDSPHVFTCGVEHMPCERNYSHSEVRWYKNGHHERNMSVPKTAKKVVRQKLAQRAQVLRGPDI